MNASMPVRLIAFYLPQFHPIPENNAAWGPGFTEWTNVVRARPRFRGHYQPHLPADLGFYDLRLPETREAQAELAQTYSVHGFCYYHYWFNGRRVLERPFNEVLSSGKPDLPFCLCWANENWTRRWDGRDQDVILQQEYSDEDDRRHLESLLPALRDERYIGIDGRPLLLIWRTAQMPDPRRTTETWRAVARRNGIGELYLARVEFPDYEQPDPRNLGFDASVEFAPDWANFGGTMFRGKRYLPLVACGVPNAYMKNRVFDYRQGVQAMLNKPIPAYTRFSCVTPSWDNSARKKHDAGIVVGSTPQLYQSWLTEVVKRTRQRFTADDRIVFINAWNEWAEGCHLEPDTKYGHQYLQATRNALISHSDSLSEAGQTRVAMAK